MKPFIHILPDAFQHLTSTSLPHNPCVSRLIYEELEMVFISNGGRGGGGGGTGRCFSSFVDEGSTESHRYYLSRRTLLEMLRDRGYHISNSEIEFTLQQFQDLHGQAVDVDRLRINASHVSEPDNKENMTRMMMVTDVQDIIKRHQDQIITSLKDPDISMQRRALDLLYGMCDVSNAKDIVEELLQPYAALKAREYPDKTAIHETMVKASAYLLEEYNHLLSRRPGCSPKDIFVIIHEKLKKISLEV
uniref:RNA polymerase Rpb5 N-terminal domain-containing protein n=1 Tax=Lactuca sativa TaxID=4236 RepID=A0A9R1XTR8_LACSA|nr:hypothetical protein LSAT_V11C100009900 [Lactuca sativa]